MKIYLLVAVSFIASFQSYCQSNNCTLTPNFFTGDTLRVCGNNYLLDAGNPGSAYLWSTGSTSQVINVSANGLYSCIVSQPNCSVIDSVYLIFANNGIINNDTSVCLGGVVELLASGNCNPAIPTTPQWQLLIPASSYSGSEINFSPGGFDQQSGVWYSVLKNNSIDRVYAFDLNNNTVANITANNAPSELFNYALDKNNNRLVASRVGRDAVYSLPVSGGSWQQIGSGGFDAESYGCSSFWNRVSSRYGYFGGYGFFSTKNWIWENNGLGWLNPYVNNDNCNPAKRVGNRFAFNADGSKFFVFSGQGSCNGDQFASSCALGSPWATDVGMFCWLRDLWEVDLSTYQFTNILPVNNQSITREGAFAYDYENNTFYNIGGRAPTGTYGVYSPYSIDVARFRRGVDPGFVNIPVGGTAPSADRDGIAVFDSIGNRIIYARNDGIWALNLGVTCNITYLWSTGATSSSINVSPAQTTTYYVTVSNGISSCVDSVIITVNSLAANLFAQDTIGVCGSSYSLDAGSGYGSYSWSTGDTTASITVNSSGLYYCTVSQPGCSAGDSVYVSIVDARILQPDTTICLGSTVNINSTIATDNCSVNSIPAGLRPNLQAWYPFCGNANDLSGNNHNGVVRSAVLTADRFGNPNQAYSFDDNQDIIVPGTESMNLFPFTASVWYSVDTIRTFHDDANIFMKYVPAAWNGYAIITADMSDEENAAYYPVVKAWYTKSFNDRLIGRYGSPNFDHENISFRQWYHMVFTVDADSGKIYIDGNLIAVDKWDGQSGPCTNNFIWKIGGTYSTWFKGKIDDLSVYNKALSAAEVLELHNLQSVNRSDTSRTYSWSTGATTPGISVTPAQTTTYYLTVSDGITSCTDSVTVSVNSLSVSTSSTPATGTQANGSASVTVNSGTSPYSYSWSNGPTGSSIANVPAGSYTVTVTDSVGCLVSVDIVIASLPDTCRGYLTYTQQSWGAGPRTPQGAYVKSMFSSFFRGPGFLTVGCAAGNKLRFTNYNMIDAFLPSSGPAVPLPPGTMTNPGTSYSNSLAAEVVALTMNLICDMMDPAFASAGGQLANLVVVSGPFAGMTVRQVLQEANNFLGGCGSQFSAIDIYNAVHAININFENGTVDLGYLACPVNGPRPLPGAVGSILENRPFRIAPNPTTGKLTVTGTLESDDEVIIQVITLDGTPVLEKNMGKQKKGDFRTELFLSRNGLAKGLYILKIIQGERVESYRVVLI